MIDDVAVPLTVELMLCDLTWVRRPRVSPGHHLVPTVCFKLLHLPLTAFSPPSAAARSSSSSSRVDYVLGRMCVFNGSWSWMQHQLLYSPLYCLLMDTGRRPAALVACGSFPMHAALRDLQRCLRGHGAMARRPVLLSARRGRATLRSVQGKRAATVTFTLRLGCPANAEPQLSLAAVKQQGSTDSTLKKRRRSCRHCHPEEVRRSSPTPRPSSPVPPSGESSKTSSHMLQLRTRASTTVDNKHRHRCHCCQHPQEPLESALLPPRPASRSSPSSTHVLPSAVMNTCQRDHLTTLADPALTDAPTQNSMPSGVPSGLHHRPARIRIREVAIQTRSPQVDNIRRWAPNPRAITTGSRYHLHHHYRYHQHHQRTLSRAQRHQQLTADRLMRGQPTSAVTSALVLTAAALPGITLTRTAQLRLARHLPDVRQELLAADLAARRSHSGRELPRSAAAGRLRYSPELYDAVEYPTEYGELSLYPSSVRNGLQSSSQYRSPGDRGWLQQPVSRHRTVSRQDSLPCHSKVLSATLPQFSRDAGPGHGSAVDRQLVQDRWSCRGSSRDCGTLTRRVPTRDRALNTPSLQTRNVAVQWQDEQQHRQQRLAEDSSYDVVSETGPSVVTAKPDVTAPFKSFTDFKMLVRDVSPSPDSVCADPAVEDSVKKNSACRSLSEDAAAVVMPHDGVDYTEDSFESESISSDDAELVVADHHIVVKHPQSPYSLQHYGSTLTSVSGRSGLQSSVNSDGADRLQEVDAARSANELRPPFTAESLPSRGDILEMLQSLNMSNSSQQSSANSDDIFPTAAGKRNKSDSSSSTLKGIYSAEEISSVADVALVEDGSPVADAVLVEVSSVEDGSVVASVASVESAGAVVVDSGSSVSYAAVMEVGSSVGAAGADQVTAPSLAQLGRTAAGWHAVFDGAAARWSSAYQLSNSVDDAKEVIEDEDGGDVGSAHSSSRVIIGSATKGRLEMPDTVDNCGDASLPQEPHPDSQRADDDDDDISARISRFLDQMGSLDDVEDVPETRSLPQPAIPGSAWLKGSQKPQDSSIDTALTDVKASAHVPPGRAEDGVDTDSISSYMPSDLDD